MLAQFNTSRPYSASPDRSLTLPLSAMNSFLTISSDDTDHIKVNLWIFQSTSTLSLHSSFFSYCFLWLPSSHQPVFCTSSFIHSPTNRLNSPSTLALFLIWYTWYIIKESRSILLYMIQLSLFYLLCWFIKWKPESDHRPYFCWGHADVHNVHCCHC